jgi:co-chaperonin GroES (HSP10)
MNTAKIKPVGDQVLVSPDPVENECLAIPGFVTMSDKERDRLELCQTEGVLVEIAKGIEGDLGYAPGDRIIFAKYAGLLIDGADGQRYRLLAQKEIKGVFERN